MLNNIYKNAKRTFLSGFDKLHRKSRSQLRLDAERQVGCGKTWLINKWIEAMFENVENKEEEVIDPIRVTLNGMTSLDHITKAIDRQLHPSLYVKAAIIGKGILKIAGKVVLRADINIDKNGTNDATLTSSLDPWLSSPPKTLILNTTVVGCSVSMTWNAHIFLSNYCWAT